VLTGPWSPKAARAASAKLPALLLLGTGRVLISSSGSLPRLVATLLPILISLSPSPVSFLDSTSLILDFLLSIQYLRLHSLPLFRLCFFYRDRLSIASLLHPRRSLLVSLNTLAAASCTSIVQHARLPSATSIIYFILGQPRTYHVLSSTGDRVRSSSELFTSLAALQRSFVTSNTAFGLFEPDLHISPTWLSPFFRLPRTSPPARLVC
jgi:hypothetical protein